MDTADLIQHLDSIETYSPPLHDGTVNRRLVEAALGVPLARGLLKVFGKS